MSPVQDWRSTPTYCLLQSRVTQKLGQKSGHNKLSALCPNLSIPCYLPAPIINGGGDSRWKWPNFRLSRARDLNLGSGHTAYRRVSLIDFYLHTKFISLKSKKLFVDGQTGGHLRPTLFGRFRGVDLRISSFSTVTWNCCQLLRMSTCYNDEWSIVTDSWQFCLTSQTSCELRLSAHQLQLARMFLWCWTKSSICFCFTNK